MGFGKGWRLRGLALIKLKKLDQHWGSGSEFGPTQCLVAGSEPMSEAGTKT